MKFFFATPHYYTSPQLREKNINQIFSTTIYSMSIVVEKYDYCYGRLFSHSKGKFDYEIIHERAFKLTHKLLT